MTITRKIIIHCDGKDCPRGGAPLGRGGELCGYPERLQLRGSDWVKRGPKHYCPVCRLKIGTKGGP